MIKFGHLGFLGLAGISAGQAAFGQAALPVAPSAVVRPLQLTPGVTIEREQADSLPLSLDQAVATALKNNTELLVRSQREVGVKGELLAVESVLEPNLAFKAYSQAQEIDLAAMGFKPSTLAGLKIPGFTSTPQIANIVKVNTTDAEITLSQQLFNVPAFYLYKAAKKAQESANWATLSARGGRGVAGGRALSAGAGR